MTADQFRDWLAEMKSAGLAGSDAAAARLLDCHANTLVRYKERGADRLTKGD